MSKKIKGGCFCGAINFEFISGDYLVANCHCQMCRKTSAAPFVTWVVVPKANFNYTQGQPSILKSSEKGQREFCHQCGTPMVFRTSERPDVVDITTGCLENPNDFVPSVAVHDESKLKWLSHTEVSK
ncbi:MAG: GFA family protein [Marinicella sp.]|nr:GFA family protein [Xanthomonadales bacterium]